MENDLIHRNTGLAILRALKEVVGNYAPVDDIDDAIDMVKTVNAIDAVEVVRCKDCKHRGIVTECPMCYTEDSYDDDYGYDYWDVDKTVDAGFCHCGEKMDAEVE